MTLYRQLAVSIIILFAVGFIGTTMISTGNLHSFLESQLKTHAQDTATSLGLSLSPHMHQQDLPIINLMIDAIFDRGYFQSIQLVDIDGNILVVRTRENYKEPVPDWFIRLVSLPTPRAEATVMSGWKQAGSIHVVSHPGLAYQELWSNTEMSTRSICPRGESKTSAWGWFSKDNSPLPPRWWIWEAPR